MERRGPTVHDFFANMGGRGEMIKTPISLQDLRRRIYAKAKAESSWRFWGLYVHVCKLETLQTAYKLAKENNGAPGIDGVTFKAVESAGACGVPRAAARGVGIWHVHARTGTARRDSEVWGKTPDALDSYAPR